MDAERIRESIAMSSFNDPTDELGEVQLLDNGSFVVEAIRPDEEGYYIVGTIKGEGSFTFHESPNLDEHERVAFESLKSAVLPKIMEAQEAELEEVDLFNLEDFPDIFPNQDLGRTLESNAAMNEGRYLKVVHALNDLLELLGYRIGKKQLMVEGGKVRVYARESNS